MHFLWFIQLTFFRELQAREPSKTLTLNAGDYFQGTVWYNEFFIQFSLLDKLLPRQTTRCCTIAPLAIDTRESQREPEREPVKELERSKPKERARESQRASQIDC